MGILEVGALMNIVASSGVYGTTWELVKDRLRQQGVENVPDQLKNPREVKEIFLRLQELEDQLKVEEPTDGGSDEEDEKPGLQVEDSADVEPESPPGQPLGRRATRTVRGALRPLGFPRFPRSSGNQDIQPPLRATRSLDAGDLEKLTRDVISHGRGETEKYRTERLRQARGTFNVALVLAIVGALLVFAGVAFVLARDDAMTGALSASVGAVSQVTGAIFFKMNGAANSSLDRLERAHMVMSFIAQIKDDAERDRAIAILAQQM